MEKFKKIKPYVYYISAAIISIILYYGYSIDILPLFINTLILIFIGNFLIALSPLIKEKINKEEPPKHTSESPITTHWTHVIYYKDYDSVEDIEDEYNSNINLESFIGSMSDTEFIEFLNKDVYGNDNPDKDAILNLLDLIKGKAGFESKEKLIYIKLAELKNNTNDTK